MTEKFGFGIIGAGVISAFHARGIEEHPDGEIVVISDVVRASAEKFAAEHGCEIEDDWREMIKRDDIETVCVCSPSGLHAEHAIAAAKAGKHVLVEKSMAINLRDATDLYSGHNSSFILAEISGADIRDSPIRTASTPHCLSFAMSP